MKLTAICLLAVLSLGHCFNRMPTRDEIEISINRTIEEVERKVQADPSLPRLTRQDIVDLLRNITTEDLSSDESKIEEARDDFQRALMVVLPYSANSRENITDLYTKPPMVQMVPEYIETNETGKRKFEFLLKEPQPFVVHSSDNLITKQSFASSESLEKTSTSKDHYKNHREEETDDYSEDEPVFEDDRKADRTPEKFSFDLEKLGTTTTQSPVSSVTTQKTVITWKPIFKKPFTGFPDSVSGSFVENVTNLSVSSTTEAAPSSKSIQHVVASDQWHYHAPPPTTPRPKENLPEKSPEKEVFPSTIQSLLENNHSQKQEVSMEVFKESDAMLSVESTEKPRPVYVTPMSDSKLRYNTTFNLAAGGFLRATTTSAPMRKEVEDLLDSIGLRPTKSSEDSGYDFKFDKKLAAANFQIPDTNNIIHSPNSGLTTIDVESASIDDQNTFENSGDNFKKGVDNLTPEVQLLFKKFGLQTSLDQGQDSTSTTTIVSPTVSNLYSYKNFKPLPNSSVRNKDMRDFLARFGLGDGEHRNQKSVKPRKITREEPSSLIEAVPGNMKSILENLGLITRSHERSEAGLKRLADSQTIAATKLHVFKPHETTAYNEDQRSKINELLETVKKVQEGKADTQAVQKVARDLLKTTKSLSNGPDPASLEEILKLYKEDLRNEVKRQQSAEKEDDKQAAEKEEKKLETGREQKKDRPGSSSFGDSMAASQEIVSTSVQASTSKPSIFDSLDIEAFAQNIATTVAPGTSSSSSSAKPSIFDSIDIEALSKNSSLSDANSSSNSSSPRANEPSLTALEDSFGGSTAAPDPVLPTRRRSGLYFLVDWNTFLEVGEDGKEKVNLRFQPKVGDRTRFLPVTVP